MIRLLLGLSIVLVMVPPAEAEEHKLPPSAPLFQYKPTFERETPRDKAVQFQLQLRREEYLDRDRSQFDPAKRDTFSRSNYPPFEDQKGSKMRFGFVIRF